MRKSRPETTIYLGGGLQRELDEYRQAFSVPPGVSAIVREAVRRFLEDTRAHEGTLAPRAWIEATGPTVARLAAAGTSVGARSIVEAIETARDERAADAAAGGPGDPQ
ncbi:MAG: hypothetical protein FJX73_10725 [Armatimonadetes bacterium]|nr:hypothetical protein [Armatimonadota bacterium]